MMAVYGEGEGKHEVSGAGARKVVSESGLQDWWSKGSRINLGTFS